jgi:hypothetical protein
MEKSKKEEQEFDKFVSKMNRKRVGEKENEKTKEKTREFD